VDDIYQIGIVGNGYVGRATAILGCDQVKVFIYDKDPEKCSPIGLRLKEIACCSLVFICVPTPMNNDGSCNVDIVESVIEELKSCRMPPENIVVRSTVPVGFCEKHGVSFMPEFLTEANWEDDFKNTDHRIVGFQNLDDSDLKMKFVRLFQLARRHGKTNKEILYNTFHVCSTSEAEMAKLARNCFLATKVSFFNEIAEFCRRKKINYKIISDLITLDPRIENSHTLVPGLDGNFGFGGTCFPKDVKSMIFQMQNSIILKSVIKRNEGVDRPEKEWEQDKGRAVSE